MPELRKDPVKGRWVIISSERGKRPNDYSFRSKNPSKTDRLCPFCPGREDQTPPEIAAYRSASSKANSPHWKIRVIPNKYPAVINGDDSTNEDQGIYYKMNGVGIHEVIIETPDHNKTLADMTLTQLQDVLLCYQERISALKKDKSIQYVLVFKNQGEVAGASLEHTHSQLIALPIIPKDVLEELRGSKEYFSRTGRCVYCDILKQEMDSKVRMVTENRRYVALIPYAARFPFETWILPKQHRSSFEDMDNRDRKDLSLILRDSLHRHKKALDDPSYNLLVHTFPIHRDSKTLDEHSFHWRIEILPRLTFVAGFEWGTGIYINPTSPEEAATFLRQVVKQR